MKLQDQIVSEARAWLGTPYCHQASVRHVGCDCLGLVRGIWRSVYGKEPETMPAYDAGWAEAGRRETLANAARRHMMEIDPVECQPGDLLAFRWRQHIPAKHVAIMVSEKTMIHAQQYSSVCEVALSAWWRRHLAFAFRFPMKVE